MKKPLLLFLVPTLIMAVLMSAWHYYQTGALPGFLPDPQPTAFEALHLRSHGVRVEGTAHYPLHMKAKVGEVTYYVWPLFPSGTYTATEIKVLVRSRVQPDPILGFEEVVVDGLVKPLSPELVKGFEDGLKSKGYTFAPGALLIDSYAPAPEEKK